MGGFGTVQDTDMDMDMDMGLGLELVHFRESGLRPPNPASEVQISSRNVIHGPVKEASFVAI